MILVPLIQPAIPYQGFNPALVVFQQIAIYFAEFDELQLVGNASFQKWPVVGVCFTTEQAFPQCLDPLHIQTGKLGDLSHNRRGRDKLGRIRIHAISFQ